MNASMGNSTSSSGGMNASMSNSSSSNASTQ
jgi:hypothetical protein